MIQSVHLFFYFPSDSRTNSMCGTIFDRLLLQRNNKKLGALENRLIVRGHNRESITLKYKVYGFCDRKIRSHFLLLIWLKPVIQEEEFCIECCHPFRNSDLRDTFEHLVCDDCNNPGTVVEFNLYFNFCGLNAVLFKFWFEIDLQIY